MADLLRKYKSLYSSTTNSFGTGEAVTITPSSVTGLPTDTEIVLTFDQHDSTGNDITNQGLLERIKGTISGGNFVVASGGRGYDGTTEQAHTSPVVEGIWNAKDWNDMVDWGVTGHDQAGRHTTTLTKIADTTTPTKLFAWQLSGATASKTVTLISSHTDNRSITLPDASDTLVGKATTDTLTNKRITKRVYTTTSTSTLTPEISTYDLFILTAQAAALNIANHSTSTPADGDMMMIQIQPDATPRAITYGDKYVAKAGTALPSTTTASKRTTMIFIWCADISKWNLLFAGTEA